MNEWGDCHYSIVTCTVRVFDNWKHLTDGAMQTIGASRSFSIAKSVPEVGGYKLVANAPFASLSLSSRGGVHGPSHNNPRKRPALVLFPEIVRLCIEPEKAARSSQSFDIDLEGPV